MWLCGQTQKWKKGQQNSAQCGNATEQSRMEQHSAWQWNRPNSKVNRTVCSVEVKQRKFAWTVQTRSKAHRQVKQVGVQADLDRQIKCAVQMFYMPQHVSHRIEAPVLPTTSKTVCVACIVANNRHPETQREMTSCTLLLVSGGLARS